MKVGLWITFFCSVTGFILCIRASWDASQKTAKPDPLTAVAAQTGDVYSFAKVIATTCGKNIWPFDQNDPIHQQVYRVIMAAAEETRTEMSQPFAPVRQNRRINEASKHFEDALRLKIDTHPKFTCSIPKNQTGNEQRSGYPDLRIEHIQSSSIFYLDPKLFEEKSKVSSLRTFYFEPSKTHKITEDAVHLLIGFPHDGKARMWTFGRPQLVDLSDLKVKLKTEFSASNKDLYGND
ncbi:MAG: hypothetical protein ACON5H_10550 [Akkermansiaceae bacterium]